MNGGDACRTIEDTRSGGFHADVRGLCAALGQPSEPPPSSGRSEAVTHPYADAFADTMASPTALASDDPSWCVDTGSALLTMTTFDLWEALERGEVVAPMRVWREGMECWTPIGDIAEFAWAIAGTPPPPPEPETLPSSAPPPEAVLTPLPFPTDPVAPPPASAIRPVTSPARRKLPDARWLALGSAVALAAVLSAIFVHEGPNDGGWGQSHREEPPAAPPIAPVGAPAAETAIRLRPPTDDPPAPEAVTRHDDPGQRRLSRGGRRVYGR
jgi:hypothetical protein